MVQSVGGPYFQPQPPQGRSDPVYQQELQYIQAIIQMVLIARNLKEMSKTEAENLDDQLVNFNFGTPNSLDQFNSLISQVNHNLPSDQQIPEFSPNDIDNLFSLFQSFVNLYTKGMSPQEAEEMRAFAMTVHPTQGNALESIETLNNAFFTLGTPVKFNPSAWT